MRYAIGVDLGGSSAKIGLVSERGELVAKEVVPTLDSPDPVAVLEPWMVAVEEMCAKAAAQGRRVEAFGCGVSGYLDPTRTVVDQNNTAALDGFALTPWLERRLGLPVAIDNDACMAAIAEVALAGTRPGERILFVTVGSGIGVVLLVDGQVVRVMHGVTGDAAHIIVDAGSSETCPLGCYGCLETVASARAIARKGQEAAETGHSPVLMSRLRRTGIVTSKDVAEAAAADDAAALAILNWAGDWLGVGLASWAPVYEPDVVLIGGGVSQAGSEWLAAAEASMRAHGCPFFTRKIRLRLAALGNQAGMIGAGLVALRAG